MRRGSPVVVSMSMINADRDSAPSARVADARSPFVRLAELLADINPGKPAINLSVGEPQHPIPSFVGPTLAAHLAEFGRYPAGKGTESFRRAAAGWLGRRYRLKRPVDPENEIIVLSGTREGLFLAAIAATAAHAFLPDLDLLDDALLSRAVAFYLASPANPQGAVANQAYLSRLAGLARRHGFLVFTDECYSEIYSEHAPPGMLEAACPDFANAVVFHSLSKRSSLPGLRVGFAAGDRRFIGKFLDLRNVSSAQVPEPAQAVAVVAYADETHVEENRRLYAAKFDLADQIIGDRYAYRRPPGGFFLWLDVGAVGGGEQASLRLWREAGLRVLPGRFIARDQADGSNPGADYIRVALVQDKEATAEALHRLVAVLG